MMKCIATKYICICVLQCFFCTPAYSVDASHEFDLQGAMDTMQSEINSAVDAYIEAVHKDVEAIIKDAGEKKVSSNSTIIIIDDNGNHVSVGSVENHGGEQQDIYEINNLNDVIIIVNGKKEK